MSLRPLLAILVSLLVSSALEARPQGRNDPGSLLVFPEVDARPGRLTVLTVTNTNGSSVDGTIGVHFHYVDGADCSRSNAFEILTPWDTVTAFTGAHAPSIQQGYAYAYAVQGATPVDFDHLAGSAMILDAVQASEYAMNALVFQAQPGAGLPTDLDGDGIRDLDGLEYAAAPERIAVPRFLGQLPGGVFQAELLLIGLSGGTRFTTSVDFLVFNDNEEVFSAEHTFACWERVPLAAISGIFTNDFLLNATNQDPGEVIGGAPVETGWFLVDGGVAVSPTTTIPDPAVLAVLVETRRLSSATLPFTLGTQTNGDLLPTSNGGDQ